VLVALETMRQALNDQFARLQIQRDELAAQSKELAIAKERAESFEQLKSTFLRNMSHELRTPLNGILGVFQLISMGDVPPDQAELLSAGEASAQTLNELIGDMLFYANLRAGHSRDDRLLFDIAETVQSVRRQFLDKAEAKNLKLTVSVGTEVPEGAFGNPDYLRRALSALVDNAVKFSTTGTVTLEVDLINTIPLHDNGLLMEFRVIDSGPGIPEEQLERLFAAFVQEDGSETRQRGGVGIGLALTKALAEAMHGELDGRNRVEGGAIFTLRLPLQKATAA
jgi:signal transduction histidine kinase